MFNVTVLKLRDIIKFLIGILLIFLIVFFIGKNTKKGNSEDIENNENKIESNIIGKIESKISALTQNSMLQALDQTIPAMSNVNEEYKKVAKEDDSENKDILQEMIGTQISSIKSIEKLDETKQEEKTKENNNDNNNNENVSSNETQNTTETAENKVAEEGVKTEVITNNPIKDSSNTQYKNVKIKNETDYNLTEEMLNPDDIKIENKNIVLFHTHSCESYTASEKYQYTPTGNYRTTDKNFNMIRVGTELETYLKSYNYNVVHNTDYHDYPSYNGSYTRSLKTVENILQTTPSDIIIDVHRDAIGSRSDYAPTVKIGDEEAAQLMFVIGTNDGGLWHPNWNQNLKFAIKIQQKAEEMYPGLFKTMMLTKSRYNQHTGKYASIIEVGATGNTLDQCLVSMKYLAKVMHEVIQ